MATKDYGTRKNLYIQAQVKRKRCPKVEHPSFGKAEAHLRHLIQMNMAQPGDMESYFCSGCNAWHVGHVKGCKNRARQYETAC